MPARKPIGMAGEQAAETTPVHQADRLMMLWETDRSNADARNDVSPANFLDWRSTTESFVDLAALAETSVNLTGEGEPERLVAHRASASIFPLLGVQAALGRVFSFEENESGAGRVVVLSDGLWRRRFGGRRDVLGSTIRLDDEAHQVIGVLPSWFEFPSRRGQIYMPLAMTSEERSARRSYYLRVLGRLQPDTTLQQARAEMVAIGERLAEAHPDSNADHGIEVVPLGEEMVSGARTPLLVLLAAVGLVLLIACVNVANLLLFRATSRHREVMVRSALGASRSRLFGQFLTEAVVIAGISGCFSVFFHLWMHRLAETLIPEHLALGSAVIEPTSSLFILLLSLLVGFAIGMLPALELARAGSGPVASASGARGVLASSRRRVGKLLVVGEVALALVLLVTAGLMVQSFRQLTAVSPGFRSESVLTLRVELSKNRYADHATKSAFYRELLRRVDRLPGVTSAGFVTMLPLTFQGGATVFEIENRSVPNDDEPVAVLRSVSPDYFRAMGIPLLEGRPLNEADDTSAPKVAIINESLARRFFSDESPLGQKLKLWGEAHEVVAVVGDVREMELGEESRPTVYVPVFQRSFGFFDPRDLAVRTRFDPTRLAREVRAEIASLDPDQPVSSIRTMNEIVEGSIEHQKIQSRLFAAFGVGALFLATLGIYAVLSHSVAERRNEIGLRMALGARRTDVLRMVVAQGLRWTLAGVLLGLLGAWSSGRFLAGMLYELEPNDPWVLALTTLFLTFVALAACLVPGLRATQVDPLEALEN